jgi:hypothetical protein
LQFSLISFHLVLVATSSITPLHRYRRSMQSVMFSTSPSSPQSSGAMLPDVQQRSPRATWTHVQRQCDMGPGDPVPYHSVTMTVVANRRDSRVDNSALIQSSSPRLDRLHTLQPAQPEGPASSPVTAISPDRYNFQLQDSHHAGHLPLNGFQQAPISEVSSGQSGAPQPLHESIGLSSNSSAFRRVHG